MASTGRYFLYITSATTLTLNPEFDIAHDIRKIETQHRSRSGKLYKYIWGSFDRFTFTLNYVNSSDAAIVNSWWESNAELLLQDRTDLTQIWSVYLTSPNRPLTRNTKPYIDLYSGKVVLETY